MNPKPKKLLDRVRETIRLKKYSDKTEQAYLNWIKRYILFHGKKHPQDMALPTRFAKWLWACSTALCIVA
jgi:hypothetical protein